MERFYLLSAGHGGTAFGHYRTPGKRSPGKRKPADPGIFEGEFNRDICNRIVERDKDGAFLFINPGPINISLKEKIGFVNWLAQRERVCLIEIHANAAKGPSWSTGHGFAVFHSWNASNASEILCDFIRRAWIQNVPEIFNRGIKVEDYSILKKTDCPAVLIESGFMTNRSEAELLSTDTIRESIADAIYQAVFLFDSHMKL